MRRFVLRSVILFIAVAIGLTAVRVATMWPYLVSVDTAMVPVVNDHPKKLVCTLGSVTKHDSAIGPDWKSSSACVCEEVAE